MKKFLAIYQASPESIQQMANATPEQSAAVMGEWMKWKEANEKHIVDFGAPVMPAACSGGAVASGNVSGYSLLQATDMEELKQACANHPHADIEFLQVIDM
ncbi:MAG: hypothetical protein HQ500_12515 [Flavobacteriales bacterium]|nr:hypothetical protein [Flavobacteriales bacterium]